MKKKFAMMLLLIFLVACATPGAVPVTPSPAPTPTVVEATETPEMDEPVSSEDPTPQGTQAPSPLEPIPGEAQMARGEVFIESSEVLILESFPPQLNLHVEGALPTPCHQLRAEVSGPDAQNRINVELYSLVEPETICIQVLEPFEETISLGSFESGTYTILINGEPVEEVSL